MIFISHIENQQFVLIQSIILFRKYFVFVFKYYSYLFIQRIINTSSRLNRSAKRSTTPNPLNIIEIDEDDDIENGKNKSLFNNELVRSTTSFSFSTTKKEVYFSRIFI